MALKISADLSAYPEGESVEVAGVLVENGGGTVDVTPEQEALFYQKNERLMEDALSEQEGTTVTGSAEFDPPPPDVPTVTPEITPEITAPVQVPDPLPPEPEGGNV